MIDLNEEKKIILTSETLSRVGIKGFEKHFYLEVYLAGNFMAFGKGLAKKKGKTFYKFIPINDRAFVCESDYLNAFVESKKIIKGNMQLSNESFGESGLNLVKSQREVAPLKIPITILRSGFISFDVLGINYNTQYILSQMMKRDYKVNGPYSLKSATELLWQKKLETIITDFLFNKESFIKGGTLTQSLTLINSDKSSPAALSRQHHYGYIHIMDKLSKCTVIDTETLFKYKNSKSPFELIKALKYG